MKEHFPISDREKWQAVVNCDKSYDGLFFYGVKTTGIFCRPSCRAKTPVRGNVVFFDNAEAAIGEGFRPCKKCRPDKAAYEPDLELVKKAKDILDLNYNGTIELSNISRQLGVSTNHLARLFKKQLGLTPMRYITGLRVEKAAELLKREDTGILEIAYMTGFNSLSRFYKCFKAQTGLTPKEQRKNGGNDDADDFISI
ncbi:MAG: Ada metal-binding domain-containing protein [Clostridiaceae bacterium]|jgi:AraC family transcriptional regulator of adaptative response / methylphosphotriester-DNA alkyltransferase methyltransferase|nr:Ada metal-binding domain-containing protein [Clostridiaceae bacterium]